MTYTAQQLAELRSALAEGVLTVRFSDGRSLTYRSLDEMLQIEAKMAKEVEASGQYKPARRKYFSFQRA